MTNEAFFGKDGNFHKIKGLWSWRPNSDNIGFFGALICDTTNMNAIYKLTVQNLTVEVGAHGITGRTNVGTLAGYATGIEFKNVKIVKSPGLGAERTQSLS